ncbi:MAG: cell division protein FtsA [Alphaproteobacteria bacterium]|nr:cell division protein FtsA [Alphaproteobacteria bacterium]
MDKVLAKARSGMIAALDVGTTKICCFIARNTRPGGLRVIGVGHQAAAGTRGGEIIDMEAVESAILSAVHSAETMAGERVREVFVNVSGGRPQSSTVGARITVAGNEVSSADLRRVLDECRHRANGDGRAMIHSIPIGYAVDANAGIRDPRGMFGQSLGVDMHFVTASAGAMRNLKTCLSSCHLSIAGQVVTPYASALACLVEDEMRLGVTLVDMGGGATTLAGFADGDLVYTAMVPVGGMHVTNDIAIGLNTQISHVERIKALYGSAVHVAGDEEQVIDVPMLGEEDDGGHHQVPRAELVNVIRPRLEETFELVRARMEASGMPTAASQRVVLTGGASQLQGARELAATVLERPVRLGRPLKINGLAEATGGPAFSTCAGLLRYAALNRPAEPVSAAAAPGSSKSFISRMGVWLRENF